jgi:hypothetical protein
VAGVEGEVALVRVDELRVPRIGQRARPLYADVGDLLEQDRDHDGLRHHGDVFDEGPARSDVEQIKQRWQAERQAHSDVGDRAGRRVVVADRVAIEPVETGWIAGTGAVDEVRGQRRAQ